MSRLAAALLFLAGLVHVILGVSAIAGASRLEANIREITTSASGGELYFSLGTWGAIVGLAGIIELAASRSVLRGSANAWLFGLIAAFLAMGASFFSLSIFRWPIVVTIVLLITATYVLAYRVADKVEASEPR